MVHWFHEKMFEKCLYPCLALSDSDLDLAAEASELLVWCRNLAMSSRREKRNLIIRWSVCLHSLLANSWLTSARRCADEESGGTGEEEAESDAAVMRGGLKGTNMFRFEENVSRKTRFGTKLPRTFAALKRTLVCLLNTSSFFTQMLMWSRSHAWIRLLLTHTGASHWRV